MDQTRGVDRTKPLAEQIVDILDKRYMVEETVLGGRFQLHKKVASAIVSLASDYYFHHKDEVKEYRED